MRITNDNIIKNFTEDLLLQGKSKISVKNYKSDISHFLAWAFLKLKTIGSYPETVAEIAPFINTNFFNEYKSYMVENKIKNKTINRRLSTLRNFSRFLTSRQVVDRDFMQGIQNVGIGVLKTAQGIGEEIIEKFKQSLASGEKASANTIKNYVSDTKHFLNWLEKQNKYAAQSR